ncbi:ParB/RepB/Spo0J family partition protein [Sphingomonas mollis]|uniref:ParB/RepB/Spo0J family partition protein n=1 Tax=Sphingomonas mollis TaxID=2795726 RepID=A0ABS0XU91_9SPHN|nr:ParB/RepB/Spo0J family partition protein [Sphingomonas sp. BT553]MBJ6123607.1 ParB/RepB/Spo0J family partition protein [Sphingomonas sp. BT553]
MIAKTGFARQLGNIGSKVLRDETPAGTAAQVPIDDIVPDPNNPRKSFDQAALNELAQSIETRGILQPIVLSPRNDDGKYVIRYGERRWRAAAIAKLAAVPAIIATADEGEGRALDQVVENEQRENLKNSELLDAIRQELAAKVKQAEIAKRLGRSKSVIAMYAALTDAPQPIAAVIDHISIRSAYNLMSAWKIDAEATQAYIEADGANLSAAATQRLATDIAAPPPAPVPDDVAPDNAADETATQSEKFARANSDEKTSAAPAEPRSRNEGTGKGKGDRQAAELDASLASPRVLTVFVDGRPGQLILSQPDLAAQILVRLDDGSEVSLGSLLPQP